MSIALGPLREFVYLDEVSVHSILASRRGGITTEFTENQSSSMNSELGSSLRVGFEGIGAGVNSKIQTGHVQSSQVLRKAIVQANFKELYGIERNGLALSRVGDVSVPKVATIEDLEARLAAHDKKDVWLVDLCELSRGELIEVEVELEADPIFRLVSVITTFRDLTEGNDQLFDRTVTALLPQMLSIARVLDSLLVGLVPIQGRLVDYDSASINGRDVLVHRALIDQLPDSTRLDIVRPAFMVGVAQHDLFWKDIRRVLFSKGRYTAFCRLEKNGLSDQWSPVKLADLLSGITAELDDSLQHFREIARQTIASAVEDSPTGIAQTGSREDRVMKSYVAQLAEYHLADLKPQEVETLILDAALGQSDWLDTVDGRRPVFRELTRRVDTQWGVETPNEVAYQLRKTASGEGVSHQTPITSDRSAATAKRPERFLDAEIIAIYW